MCNAKIQLLANIELPDVESLIYMRSRHFTLYEHQTESFSVLDSLCPTWAKQGRHWWEFKSSDGQRCNHSDPLWLLLLNIAKMCKMMQLQDMGHYLSWWTFTGHHRDQDNIGWKVQSLYLTKIFVDLVQAGFVVKQKLLWEKRFSDNLLHYFLISLLLFGHQR